MSNPRSSPYGNSYSAAKTPGAAFFILPEKSQANTKNKKVTATPGTSIGINARLEVNRLIPTVFNIASAIGSVK